MIKYEWRTSLDGSEVAELTDLLGRAADYDAEPEYNTIRMDDVLQSMSSGNPQAHHLVIWMLPYATAQGERDRPEQIAGLLRLVIGGDGTAEAVVVIDPRLRSIGITTLLFERCGLDTTAPEGWLGTGAHTITAWARGNHPAAGRLSNRFLIPRIRRVWKLIRSADSGFPASAAPVLEQVSAEALRDLSWASHVEPSGAYALREDGRIVGVVTIDLAPVVSEEFGQCATITGYRAAPAATARERRTLLDGAVAVAHEAGRSGLIVYVDSDDAEWVNSARLSAFQHDRTDVRFRLGGQR